MPYSKNVFSGRFTPKHPEKYKGDPTNIIYRSSYEIRFMKWADLSEHVLAWNSEEVVIPYIHPKDGRAHRYFVDFMIQVRTKSGEIKRFLVEVKPFVFTQEPVVPKRKTKRFLTEVIQYAVNQAKWKAARSYAADRGISFIIITERDLGTL
jgi:hypothetical protein